MWQNETRSRVCKKWTFSMKKSSQRSDKQMEGKNSRNLIWQTEHIQEEIIQHLLKEKDLMINM